MLVNILDAFALVGFGGTNFANIGSELTNLLLVGARNDDFVGRGNFDCDSFGRSHCYIVRIADFEVEILALKLCTVTDTVDPKLFLEVPTTIL